MKSIFMKKFGIFLMAFCLYFQCINCADQAYKNALRENTVDAYKGFIQQYPNSDLITSAEENLEMLEYKSAEEKNTVKAYKDFISKYPNSKLVKEAKDRSIEAFDYEDAEKQNTGASYKNFLSIHPNSVFQSKVLKNIEKIMEGEKDKCLKNSKIELCLSFLKEYPNSKYESLVKQNVRAIEIRELENIKDIESYNRFIKDFPSSNLRSKALEKIGKIENNKFENIKDVESYDRFIKDFPSSSLRSKALEKIEKIESDECLVNNKLDVCSKFIEKYPNSKYETLVKERLEELESQNMIDKISSYEIFTSDIDFSLKSIPFGDTVINILKKRIKKNSEGAGINWGWGGYIKQLGFVAFYPEQVKSIFIEGVYLKKEAAKFNFPFYPFIIEYSLKSNEWKNIDYIELFFSPEKWNAPPLKENDDNIKIDNSEIDNFGEIKNARLFLVKKVFKGQEGELQYIFGLMKNDISKELKVEPGIFTTKFLGQDVTMAGYWNTKKVNVLLIAEPTRPTYGEIDLTVYYISVEEWKQYLKICRAYDKYENQVQANNAKKVMSDF